MARNTHEMIRLKAYEIWEREGFPEGREREHWEIAELELGLSPDEMDGGDNSMDTEDGGMEASSRATSYEGNGDAEAGGGANPARRSRPN